MGEWNQHQTPGLHLNQCVLKSRFDCALYDKNFRYSKRELLSSFDYVMLLKYCISRVHKLERFLPKNQHTRRKLLNLENWFSGELSKFGPHFSNKII